MDTTVSLIREAKRSSEKNLYCRNRNAERKVWSIREKSSNMPSDVPIVTSELELKLY